jgi:hypothetical protein
MWTMHRFLLLAAVCIEVLTPEAVRAANCAETEPYYWQGDRRLAVYDRLVPLMACRDYGNDEEQALADATACNWFAGRALQSGFAIDDFTPQGAGWKNANAMAAVLAASSSWTYTGLANDQSVLRAAGAAASAGKAVLAIRPGAPHGHVAVILGGPLSASGGWALQVPNSASLLLGNPGSSYVGCKLSYAFQAPAGVKIYKRD